MSIGYPQQEQESKNTFTDILSLYFGKRRHYKDNTENSAFLHISKVVNERINSLSANLVTDVA